MEKREPKRTDQIGENIQLDEAVVEKLPASSKVLSVRPCGLAATVKIQARLQDGTVVDFFKKDALGHIGAAMMKGAFEAEQVLYNCIPEHVLKPLAWGTYQQDPDTHFYLCELVEMHDDLPSARGWVSTVSKLHLNSMGKSPTGQFGFHVTTHLANVPVNNSWNSSWEAFWAQQMKSLLDQDEKIHGPDEELTRLKEALFEVVIPRYLRPLESDGRSVQPCLVHSDLWPGNIKPKAESNELCMFDACAYWGHNEADIGICRNPRYKLGPPCISEYFKQVPMSEPTADFDGRNAVYAMKYHALLSIMYSKDKRFRHVLINELRVLVSKVESEAATTHL